MHNLAVGTTFPTVSAFPGAEAENPFYPMSGVLWIIFPALLAFLGRVEGGQIGENGAKKTQKLQKTS